MVKCRRITDSWVCRSHAVKQGLDYGQVEMKEKKEGPHQSEKMSLK